jgi:hypothetical protein
MMRIGIALVLALAFIITTNRPSGAQDEFEISLNVAIGGRTHSGPALSLGSVGVNSNPRDPFFRHSGNDPDHSIIPSERPAGSAPGLLLHFPLGRRPAAGVTHSTDWQVSPPRLYQSPRSAE